MKWSIVQLRKYQGEPSEFNEKANFDGLIGPPGLINLPEVNIEGELTIKSNEMIAGMHITDVYTMPCARTLMPIDVPFGVRTSEVSDLEGYNSCAGEEMDEDEHYRLATDGMVNIRDIAKELVVIEKPMRAFSESSDQVLTKGNGWEVTDGEQVLGPENPKNNSDFQTHQVNPRFQKSQQLYDRE